MTCYLGVFVKLNSKVRSIAIIVVDFNNLSIYVFLIACRWYNWTSMHYHLTIFRHLKFSRSFLVNKPLHGFEVVLIQSSNTGINLFLGRYLHYKCHVHDILPFNINMFACLWEVCYIIVLCNGINGSVSWLVRLSDVYFRICV